MFVKITGFGLAMYDTFTCALRENNAITSRMIVLTISLVVAVVVATRNLMISTFRN